MRDKRPVDELSIEELERILVIRKREARMKQMRERGTLAGRRVMPVAEDDTPAVTPERARSEDVAVTQNENPTVPREELIRANLPRDYYDGTPQFEDELDARLAGEGKPRRANWRKWWNRALTLVEIAAVIGLVVLLVGTFQSFQQATEKSAQIQAEAEATRRALIVPPTPTPVIAINRVVLPSGHRVEGDEAVFNFDEIPARFRDQYAAYLKTIPISRPTPSPEGPIRIRIPAIKVDSVVVAGDDPEALKQGVGQLIGSANPGQPGNMVLSGHNDVYGEVFRYLDQLKPGDPIIVQTRTREYTYIVQPQNSDGQVKGHIIVYPSDVWVLEGRPELRQLTLISCWPYRVDDRRVIIFATLAQ